MNHFGEKWRHTHKPKKDKMNRNCFIERKKIFAHPHIQTNTSNFQAICFIPVFWLGGRDCLFFAVGFK